VASITAGGQLLSGLRANAAWWAIMVLALDLHQMMKRLVPGDASFADASHRPFDQHVVIWALRIVLT
jgi:hypothetical protein